MSYKVGESPNQLSFMPFSLDEFVPQNHVCRVISAFTESLDMVSLDFKYSKVKSTDCRPYVPRMMLNLYIYGYLNRIRSSRRLFSETNRNVEVMWLMNKLTPDDRTICNFRKDNAAAIKKTFREFTLLCKELGLYGGEVVAIDGTKIRANNSLNNNLFTGIAEDEISKIDKRINEYIAKLEKSDEEEAEDLVVDKGKIETALAKIKARKAKIEGASLRLSEPGGISLIDPDAKRMKQGGDSRGTGVCYNIQAVVDDKHNLLAHVAVTDNTSDRGNLHELTEEVKEILEVDELSVLADKGYYNGEDIAACEKNGVKCYVPKQYYIDNKRAKNLDKNFSFEHFKYDSDKDCYICPMGVELKFRSLQKNRGRLRKYYCNTKACRKCINLSKCGGKTPRGITGNFTKTHLIL